MVSDAGDHYAVTGRLAPLAIPTTLHASLLARLDRLAPTREVAARRSVVHSRTSAVAQMAQQKLDEALEQLESAELVFRRGTPPDARCTFKHKVEAETVHRYKIGYHAAEYRFFKKDGSYCWVSDEWHLIRDESGEPVEIVGSWSGITVRKQALEES